jgi:Fe-S cluster biosynthesis and repair protein YggX
MWYSLNEERDGKSFMGYNEFHGMKLVYTVSSNTWESWKQGDETPIVEWTSHLRPSIIKMVIKTCTERSI